jgi:hypothetical protein
MVVLLRTACVLALWASSCGGGSAPSATSDEGGGLPPEVDNDPARFLALQSGLESLNQLVEVVNKADAEEDALEASLAKGPAGPQELFAHFHKAEEAWNAVLEYLEVFTPEQKAEISSLTPALKKLSVAAAYWNLYLASYQDFIITTLGQGEVDRAEGRRVNEGYKLARDTEQEAMGLVSDSQDEAILAVCEIEDYNAFVSGEDNQDDCPA